MVVENIDLVGNGASNALLREYRHYTIACNVPQHGIKYNALSIIDTRPLNYMKEKAWRPKVPVYCTQQVKDYANKLNIEGDWFPTYERKHRWNSGHHAVLHHHRIAKTMHLWGFDSMFSTDLSSQCDSIIPRYTRPPLNNHWHPIWREILDTIDCKIVLHLPKGASCAIQHEKITPQEHETADLEVFADNTQHTA